MGTMDWAEMHRAQSILITGATGFVGRFLCSRLLAEGWTVRGTLLASENSTCLVEGVEPVVIEPLGSDTPWSQAVTGSDTIIHLAARVHVMHERANDPLKEFQVVNTVGTERLAREAAN